MSRWALGVLVYEMVAGYPPFYDEDRVAMFKNICHVKYTFPSSFGKARAAPQRSSLRKSDSRMPSVPHAARQYQLLCVSMLQVPKPILTHAFSMSHVLKQDGRTVKSATDDDIQCTAHSAHS